MLNQANYIVFIVRVFLHQETQQLAFLHGEFVIDLSVAVDFDGYFISSHVVDGRDNLSEATLAKHFNNLKSVKDLVSRLQNVVSLFIILIRDGIGNA